MFRLRTLGGLTLERGGEPHGGPATQRRRLALLALTASADARGIAREKLAAYLWPESEPARARHSLDDALSALRRELGSEALFLGVASLRLNPEVLSSDLAEFGAAIRGGDLERAVSLYGGPFLDGFNVGGVPEFERWVDAERARLAHDYGRALEQLAAAAEARGDAVAATGWWRRRVSSDPLNTRATLGLIGSLAAAGEKGEALRVARVHDALVREELGAEPDPRLTAAVESLRTAPAPPSAPAVVTRTAVEVPPVAAREAAVHESGAATATVTAAGPTTTPALAPDADAPAASTPPAARASLGVERRDSGWHGTRGMWRRRHGTQLIGIAALITLLAAAVYASRRGQGGAAGDGTLDPHRVAVIPFDNATGDPRFDALGAMVADVTTQAIVQSGFLRVVSSPSALVPTTPAGATMRTGGRESAAEFGRRLEAGTVVSGAIYKQGDSLRFQAQLTDVSREEVASVLAPTVGPSDDPAGAVHAIRERVLASLATQADARLATWARVVGPPPSYEVYREFVAGRAAWPDYRRALRHFVRAAAMDSTYAFALIEIATIYRVLDECEKTDSVAALVLRRVPQLAPFDRLFLQAQVSACHGDFAGAHRDALEMRRLAPRSASVAYSVFHTATALNRLQEGLDALEGFDLESGGTEVGLTYYTAQAQALHQLGRHGRELEIMDAARRRFPASPQVEWMRAVTLSAMGRVTEAVATVDTLIRIGREDGYPLFRGLNAVIADLYLHGHPEAAAQVEARTLALLTSRPAAERSSVAYLRELGPTQYRARNWADAFATFRALVALDTTNVDARGWLGVAAARVGDRATAESAAAWLARLDRPFLNRHLEWQARIAALLGDRQSALAFAEQSLARDGYGIRFAHFRFDMESLRGWAPFEELMRPKE